MKKGPKSHIVNSLLTSFVRSVLESIWPRFFPRRRRSFVARSVRKPHANTFSYRPRIRLISNEYLLEVFVQTERRRSDVCAQKTPGQIFSGTYRTNEVNKEFIIWLLPPFFTHLAKLCSWVSRLGSLVCFYVFFRGFLHLFTKFSP